MALGSQLASSDHVSNSPLDHLVIVAQVIHCLCDSLSQIIQVFWRCGEKFVFKVAPQKEVTWGKVWGPCRMVQSTCHGMDLSAIQKMHSY